MRQVWFTGMWILGQAKQQKTSGTRDRRMGIVRLEKTQVMKDVTGELYLWGKDRKAYASYI